jgi:hypothetical protein
MENVEWKIVSKGFYCPGLQAGNQKSYNENSE